MDVRHIDLDAAGLWSCCIWRTLAGVGGLDRGDAFGRMPPTADRGCCPERSIVRLAVSHLGLAVQIQASGSTSFSCLIVDGLSSGYHSEWDVARTYGY